MPAVFRCVSSNNSRRKNVAQRKAKTMRKQRSNEVPAAPDQAAYSQALSRGKTRDEAMVIARKRGAEVVAANAAAYRRAAAYRA